MQDMTFACATQLMKHKRQMTLACTTRHTCANELANCSPCFKTSVFSLYSFFTASLTCSSISTALCDGVCECMRLCVCECIHACIVYARERLRESERGEKETSCPVTVGVCACFYVCVRVHICDVCETERVSESEDVSKRERERSRERERQKGKEKEREIETERERESEREREIEGGRDRNKRERFWKCRTSQHQRDQSNGPLDIILMLRVAVLHMRRRALGVDLRHVCLESQAL